MAGGCVRQSGDLGLVPLRTRRDAHPALRSGAGQHSIRAICEVRIAPLQLRELEPSECRLDADLLVVRKVDRREQSPKSKGGVNAWSWRADVNAALSSPRVVSNDLDVVPERHGRAAWPLHPKDTAAHFDRPLA